MSAADLVPTIGLEVHLHLKTRTKLFCGCRVEYDARPNSKVCPVCLGMPGVLPVMNEKAVELAVRMALALGCTIPDLAKWDRKHYYYPDLPKNYQISEYDQPLGVGGHLDVETSKGAVRVGITRVHLEEDAGKLMHDEHGGNFSVVDLNRTGTPLLEVVSEPDIHSAEEARAYAEALRQLAVYLGVGDCHLQLGQMRCEPNVSLRIGAGPDGKPRYTPISEMKNLNSFRSVERAVAFEIARHRQEYLADPAKYTLENLGKETRGWNDDEGTSFLQRSKEEAHDYRYCPDPDLVPFVPDRKWVEKIMSELPEMPSQRLQRYIRSGIPEDFAQAIVDEKTVADYFDELVNAVLRLRITTADWRPTRGLKVCGDWVNQHVRRTLNEQKTDMGAFRSVVPAERLAELIQLVEEGKINRNTGVQIFAEMFTTSRPASKIVEEKGLIQVADTGAVEAFVDQALAANARTVEDYKGGKKAAFGRLMGEAMKASGGKANPQLVKEILLKKLGG
ncbi:MAG: Asp-tRNA(Asn)/Glu-tRNA(Gln) amidotransferase subunit GatB [Planctomycetota bacterium]|nr:Asp-tRNA(Asn)/Glu-tRNA(Gln) amidotransferase subunit GatB [Planctomycetota bacterium]